MRQTIFAAAMAAALLFTLTGCSPSKDGTASHTSGTYAADQDGRVTDIRKDGDDPLRRAGEDVKDAARDAKDTVKDVAKDAGDAVKKGVDDTKKAVEDMTDNAKDQAHTQTGDGTRGGTSDNKTNSGAVPNNTEKVS